MQYAVNAAFLSTLMSDYLRVSLTSNTSTHYLDCDATVDDVLEFSAQQVREGEGAWQGDGGTHGCRGEVAGEWEDQTKQCSCIWYDGWVLLRRRAAWLVCRDFQSQMSVNQCLSAC